MSKVDIEPRDDKGERHGYWEVYHSSNGKLMYTGHYVNGNEDGKLGKKKYHI
jgi:hypothetical protein